MRYTVPFICAALTIAGCQGAVEPASVNAASAARDAARIDPGTLEEIARQYQSWGRVDGGLGFAPTDCLADGGHARLSASDDASTHGGKLYFVYAKLREAYTDGLDKLQPSGQVIVKQAFAAREVSSDEAELSNRLITSRQVPAPPEGLALPDPLASTTIVVDRNTLTQYYPRLAVKDGKFYAPGSPYALFFMVKGNASDPGTDAGWLYATTSMDGKTIHSNGRVSSCMECHVDAPHDRLFGLPAVKR
jgi:hypothetical protein